MKRLRIWRHNTRNGRWLTEKSHPFGDDRCQRCGRPFRMSEHTHTNVGGRLLCNDCASRALRGEI
jgi:formylmethanofuran dehydrogenase subunit E